MEQNRPAPRRALSPKERRRRHRIRLVRNWTVFLLSCGAVHPPQKDTIYNIHAREG